MKNVPIAGPKSHDRGKIIFDLQGLRAHALHSQVLDDQADSLCFVALGFFLANALLEELFDVECVASFLIVSCSLLCGFELRLQAVELLNSLLHVDFKSC